MKCIDGVDVPWARMRCVRRLVLCLAATLSLGLSVANAGLNEDLMAAIEKGEPAKVQRALKKKANPEARGEKGVTALMLASQKGQIDVVQLLLGAGANAGTTREGGIAAIHHAAEAGQVDVLKLLLASGANPSARTDLDTTPLILSGRAGRIEVAKVLLDAGASRSEKNTNGVSPFMTTAQSTCVECLQLLRVPEEDINAKDTKGNSVLDFALASPSAAVWTYLFEQGATFEASRSAKDRALFTFIADPTNVLLKQSMPSNVEILRTLITRGANVEGKNSEGQTPLLAAVQSADLSAIQVLIEARADVAARDKPKESTALIIAADRDLLEKAKMLVALQQGASLNQLMAAVEKSDKSSATAKRHAVTRALLQAGADVKAANKDGETALHAATQIGDVELVQILLAAGADVNARTQAGRTALVVATTRNYGECVNALLAAGADTQIATQDGNTPLTIAKNNKYTDLIKVLEAAQQK